MELYEISKRIEKAETILTTFLLELMEIRKLVEKEIEKEDDKR